MNPIYQFEVHTKTKMYTIMATYFIADSGGVMFFDNQDKGIGFAPNSNLNFIRLSSPKPEDIRKALESQAKLLYRKPSDD